MKIYLTTTMRCGAISLLALLSCVFSLVIPPIAAADEPGRCLMVEFYVDGKVQEHLVLASALEEQAKHQGGVEIRRMDVSDPANRSRLEKICKHFSLEAKAPLLYGCGRAFTKLGDAEEAKLRLQQALTLTMYGRAGCPRCAAAKEYLKSYETKFPGLKIVIHDIAADSAANRELQALVAKHHTTAASVPVFHVCDQVVVGWIDEPTTSRRLEGLLEKWTTSCKRVVDASQPLKGDGLRWLHPLVARAGVYGILMHEEYQQGDQEPLPLPEEGAGPVEGEATPSGDEIVLPYFGAVRVSSVGLPLFTIAVGLVDGFNPCAMWVLVFLLSVLVNLHHRGKILAVAGTFVLVSGAFYFAFMAAWINVFQLIGMTRAVQVALGVLAILIGAIHIKDFFAFKKGISLSIPESAKPGIYDRVRRIVNAESIAGAVVGASVLAALVNIVELLCTAGLPALYTQILFSQQLATWQNYAYLLLYNVAYMFDDSLMVAVVVITLGKGKMQETHGRWLKLFSGMAIFLLGAVMIVRPQWLGM